MAHMTIRHYFYETLKKEKDLVEKDGRMTEKAKEYFKAEKEFESSEYLKEFYIY